MSDSHSPTTAAARWYRAGLVFFLVAAALGWWLRSAPVFPEWFPLPYDHILHAHSHSAFLAWIFMGLVGILLRIFPGARSGVGFWPWMFVLTVLANVGMLVSFPWQGYGAVSIAFATLHMAVSGAVAWRVWSVAPSVGATRPALRMALACLLLSGLGPVGLGIFGALDMRESPGYLQSVYWYIHCQANGWFVFFPLSIWLYGAEEGRVARVPVLRRGLAMMGVGFFLTFAIACLWFSPAGWVYALGIVGALIQGLGLVFLWRGGLRFSGGDAPQEGEVADPLPPLARNLFLLAGAVLVTKCLLQIGAGFPALAGFTAHRMVAIGFLHLIFLGLVTPFLLAYGVQAGWLRRGRRLVAATLVFLAGAAGSELLLFYPVAAAWFELPPLTGAAVGQWICATLLLIGVAGLTACGLRTPKV